MLNRIPAIAAYHTRRLPAPHKAYEQGEWPRASAYVVTDSQRKAQPWQQDEPAGLRATCRHLFSHQHGERRGSFSNTFSPDMQIVRPAAQVAAGRRSEPHRKMKRTTPAARPQRMRRPSELARKTPRSPMRVFLLSVATGYIILR